ncbi:hypothetical protein RND81_11G007400 [Saponaria officinalis]|uniref:FBD domain-containing protein n=1 Tax=Saponaria officinalis TaxID=3572 RepID=A0AAW1HGM0_SAPOF
MGIYTPSMALPLTEQGFMTDWLKSYRESGISETDVELSSDSDEDWTECCLDDVQEWLEDENNDGFKPTLPNLRRLEWCGAFRSHFEEEVLVALYIVKNATKIEKLVFDPRSILKFHHSSHPSVVDEEEDISRENVRQLARVIPKRVEIKNL